MLTLQNRVSISNLSSIRTLGAGILTARAWETLRAAVAGMALARSVSATPEGGIAAAPGMASRVDHDLPLMRRGVERC